MVLINGRKLNILVTGGAGFIGSHVVDAYLRTGHRVTVMDDVSTGKKENISPKAHFLKIDIRDRRSLRLVFAKGKFDVVNHHAAQIDVRKSVARPVEDAQINILGLLNVLEECRENHVKKIIFSSSGGTIYGECGASHPPKEDAEARPLSPYGIAKLSSELYIKAYSAIHGVEHVILRYANVYGPRQDPLGEAGVVAIFACRMLEKKPILIFGNGRQSRDFVCVEDVAKANLLALRTSVKNTTLNIGTGRLTSVNELFKIMAAHVPYDRGAVQKPARAGELMTSVLNVSRAKHQLGWAPAVSLEEGIRQTILFFRKRSPSGALP